MKPYNRETFIKYCLRNLGEPVVEVNVDDDQVDDRVDEALEFFNTYHYDGIVKTYLKHQITQENKDTGKIRVPDYIWGVSRIVPTPTSSPNANPFFDVNYQMMLSDLYSLTSTDIVYNNMLNSHLTLLNDLLNAVPSFQFNKYIGDIEFPGSTLDKRFTVGSYLVIECYRAVNPNDFSKVWNDSWLKRYATALIKRTWATNLKKYSNMMLPGGVQIDGIAMYQEAVDEISNLEETLMNKLAPLQFFMG